MGYKDELKKKYKKTGGVSLQEIIKTEEAKDSKPDEELNHLKRIEKQAREVVFVWNNFRYDSNRLNKELKKLYELTLREK